jgi:PIN domain nuclease of toxin-antitoxin system
MLFLQHLKTGLMSNSQLSLEYWRTLKRSRIGKLNPGMELNVIAGYLASVRIKVLPVSAEHAAEFALPEPSTKDPFDRMLLAVCSVENLKLMTIDRALALHPLSARLHQ